jgi:antitoxin component YwqK of YwqJK toxin-antitoxin module
MTQQDFNDAFILLLSGSAKLNQYGEIEWKGKCGDFYYISFPSKTPTKVVVARYWSNGKLNSTTEFQNGIPHGTHTRYYFNGKKFKQFSYQNGKLHGLSSEWSEKGNKYWENEYQNGELINNDL